MMQSSAMIGVWSMDKFQSERTSHQHHEPPASAAATAGVASKPLNRVQTSKETSPHHRPSTSAAAAAAASDYGCYGNRLTYCAPRPLFACRPGLRTVAVGRVRSVSVSSAGLNIRGGFDKCLQTASNAVKVGYMGRKKIFGSKNYSDSEEFSIDR